MPNSGTTAPTWDDVCWEMVMRCEPADNEIEGFKPPSSDLVAEFAALYPQFADDLIDFAATCRVEEIMLRKYPPPEPTQAEIDAGVKRAMRSFRKAMRKTESANGQ